jgi:hypothetical protein
LQWTGNDPDGDELTYIVQYSFDGGVTWETLVVDWPQTSYEVENDQLRGTSNGLIRVKASDGFFTASDESDDVFSVPNHPPDVSLLSPSRGSVYFDDTLIFFEAEAEDLEDGSLSGPAVAWKSNLNGHIGHGKILTLNANELLEGTHFITVTATDTEGLSDNTSIAIRVNIKSNPMSCIPLLLLFDK